MWLDDLVPEGERQTRENRLQFTQELPAPPPLLGEWIFWCYGIAAAVMLVVVITRIAKPALHIRKSLGGQRRSLQFIRLMLPTSIIVFIWSSALLGTTLSAVVILFRWIALQ